MRNVKQPKSNMSKTNQPDPLVPSRSTGPRTQQGKERSKRNSIKHGIFSAVIVLQTESKGDFDSMLGALREDRQPEGSLEELLVNKLAVLWWRLRRVWTAETAEIRSQTEFIEWEANERNRENAAKLPQLISNGGLVRWIAHPEALEECLNLLKQLKEDLEGGDFNKDNDPSILMKLYGDHDEMRWENNWKSTLFDSYERWCETSLVSEEERADCGYASPGECKRKFLEELKVEIQRLGHYRKERAKMWASKVQLEVRRRSAPEGPKSDRLLRYETFILREIDRTLSQLERVQRIRLGQLVPPPINLNVTTSRS